MFEREIERYEKLRAEYDKVIVGAMTSEEYLQYSEVLFSAHSCAIEGNSFTVDDTRELKEKGLGMIPAGKTLFEAFEMLDHFAAFEYVAQNLSHVLDEAFVKETNRLVTLHTLGYRHPGAVPGEYTDCDMAAGDTVFGDHRELVACVPALLASTEEALSRRLHPLVVAARFHGFFEYLHPFRDGNGRTGRLLSNFIMMRAGHRPVLIHKDMRGEYIAGLRAIRTENTDEHLIAFFFKVAIGRMESELRQKRENTRRMMSIMF